MITGGHVRNKYVITGGHTRNNYMITGGHMRNEYKCPCAHGCRNSCSGIRTPCKAEHTGPALSQYN